MRVKLERVKNGIALRTSEVIGEADGIPCVGRSFMMSAPPLDPAAAVRMVTTSRVVAIIVEGDVSGGGETLFQTENSTYRLTRLPDAP